MVDDRKEVYRDSGCHARQRNKEITKMKINKAYIAAGLVVAVSLFFGLVAFADQSDQTTIFTFSEPIQIPGVVLPAGTYVFKLTNTESSQGQPDSVKFRCYRSW
jgi:hypothetical protein